MSYDDVLDNLPFLLLLLGLSVLAVVGYAFGWHLDVAAWWGTTFCDTQAVLSGGVPTSPSC